MKVKIKKVRESAIIPTKAHTTDAGYDLYADSCSVDACGNAVYGTGVAMEIPKGYVGLVFPRSSNYKKDLSMCNSVGVIDSGYRGEIMAKFKPTSAPLSWILKVIARISLWPIFTRKDLYKLGDRIAQIVIIPYPEIEFEEVDKLSNSDRGENGHGSSGE